QKVRANAARQDENKRKWENNLSDYGILQKAYAGNLPYYNKCKLHHVGSCIVKCGNCKRVGHMTKDSNTPVAATNQRAPVVNHKATTTCYECGRQGHYKGECLKFKNQNHINHTGNREAQGIAFALGGGEANQDSHVVTGTFILNNRYASILFDSGADRSFVSTTFSSLIAIIPTALDVSYVVELADGKITGADYK
ncbi:putative reverse transcriptase domain-containing protein, partial [Tanacetum coccineum]